MIVIAGAGIGGMVAALALRRAGHQVLLCEQARKLTEVGAGLQLSPNACTALAELGVLENLKPHVVAPERIRMRSAKSGRDLASVPLGSYMAEKFGMPYWVIHRADLQKALLQKIQDTDGIVLELDTQIVSAEHDTAGTLLCFYQKSAETGTISCQALIGADGVWSKIRKLIPNHEYAHYSGQVAYRATLLAARMAQDFRLETNLWLGQNAHLVYYPVRGGAELNIVALFEEAWQEETWSAPADRNMLLAKFRDWPVEVRSLLSQPDAWLKWALCRVDAGAPWVHGNIALLGDAAHAMLPYMAQGAAMAIEDAMTLAALLPAGETDIAAALRRYERIRKPRTERVQGVADENKVIYHLTGVPAFARNTALKFLGPNRLAERFDWIYGWRSDTATQAVS